MSTNDSRSARVILRELLQGDVREALGFLNSTTSHRFTALYRFDGNSLRNVYFYDRENPGNPVSEDIPVEASYCVFVRDQKRTWTTENSEEDDRANGHLQQFVVRSYCGVPLVDDHGKVFGSVCHFDFEKLPFTPEAVSLMELVAELLPENIK